MQRVTILWNVELDLEEIDGQRYNKMRDAHFDDGWIFIVTGLIAEALQLEKCVTQLEMRQNVTFNN